MSLGYHLTTDGNFNEEDIKYENIFNYQFNIDFY